MTKKIFSLCTIFLCSHCLGATALSGPYMRVFGGFSHTPNNINVLGFSAAKYRNGYNVGGNLGYKSGPIRYEFEGTYIHNKLKRFNFNGVRQTSISGKGRSSSLMLNLFYDFEDFNASVAPFIGAGIGYSYTSIILNSQVPTVARLNRKKFLFSYQGLAGIVYNFSENVAIDLGYRYFRTKTSNRMGKVYQAHLANFGAIYRFDN